MKVIQNIVALTILLLLPAGMTAQTTPSPLGRVGEGLTGFVVFDSNTIFVENNSLSVQNGFTTVLNNTNSVVLVVSNSTPPPHASQNNSLNKPKTLLKRLKTVVVKTQKAKPEIKSPTLITWGNSPYGNNSYFAGANNFFAVLPSTTTKKSTTNIHLVCHFDEGDPRALLERAKQIAFEYSKRLFQSHETIIIPNNYSKTSRIRPPPSPPTPEGGVANC